MPGHQIALDVTFIELCREILSKGLSESEWASVESDDAFQVVGYEGGFDADENAFCFSAWIDGREWWFQLTLAEVQDVAENRKSTVDARLASTSSDTYILDRIRIWVRSGFYSQDELHEIVDDLLEDDADEKAREEATWSGPTDCDRLDNAFEILESSGLVALQNAGNTLSEGHVEAGEALAERGGHARGYCFYHGQDTERAVDGGGLMLAFGSFDDDPRAKASIGELVRDALKEADFVVEWNGDPETRIEIPGFEWKRRTNSTAR